MIIIAFSNKTSKIFPRIFCGKLKHVAPIIINNNRMIMMQFVRPGVIYKIPLKMRDINILAQYGWKFIYLNTEYRCAKRLPYAITCVQFVKKIINLSDWRIQTPCALYKKLRN